MKCMMFVLFDYTSQNYEKNIELQGFIPKSEKLATFVIH